MTNDTKKIKIQGLIGQKGYGLIRETINCGPFDAVLVRIRVRKVLE